jgi:hypothetical protein
LPRYGETFGTEWTGSIIFRATIQLRDLQAEQDRRASSLSNVTMLFDDRAIDAHIRKLQGTITVPKPRKVEMGQYRADLTF